jgi:hypothetical protein
MFHITDGLKQGDALSPLLFNFDIDCAVRSVYVNQESLKLNGTFQLSVYADDVNIFGASAHTVKKPADALNVASKEMGLDVNADKSMYIVTSRDQNAGRSRNMKIHNSSFERMEQFRYLGEKTLTALNYIQEQFKNRLKPANAYYHSAQNLLSFSLLSKNIRNEIHKNIILPVVLYGCETWSLTWREERRLRVFQNRVLRRIFGPKRD